MTKHLPVSAVVAAGGRGSRLSPLTDSTPKPLLEVGGRPVIDWLLDHLVGQGIRDITVTVGYRAEQIMEHLGDGRDRGLRLRYLREEVPMGDAGVLGRPLQWNHDHLLLINADLYTDVNVRTLYADLLANEADMAVSSFRHEVSIPWGILDVEEARVRSICEKPRLVFQANAGIYLFRRSLLSLIPLNAPYKAWNLVSDAVQAGSKIVSVPMDGYWYDIGSLAEYEKVNALVAQQERMPDRMSAA